MRYLIALCAKTAIGIGLLAPQIAPAMAQADFHRVGAFVLPDDYPDTIILADDITEATPVDFFRALRERPEATTLLLLSGGGSVYGALSIAFQVHERGMTTIVPENAWCYSACAYIFFAGKTRELKGELGVHQISTDGDANLAGAQTTIADILEALGTFDVDPQILSLMFRTAADEIYVFSAAEITQYGIENAAGGSSAVALSENIGAPTQQVAKEAPEPQPVHDAPVAPVTLGSTTIMAKNSHGDDLGRAERLLTVSEPVALGELLKENGFTGPMAQAVGRVLSDGDFFDLGVLPTDTQIIVLFGPSRSSQTLIPYRLSFYVPALGRMAHQATVALTDSGQYVLGREPGAGEGSEEASASGKQNRTVDPS